ncbi:WD repeat-containing protein 43 [Desmophyllum pertusum]|uniref:WD repeat-containing protein 43 n=1 Tax=Desmophyllum pertusum TaxID=174260 RepID=A0A9W9Z1E6_9CNID|nr:WD repeat-containing protein 43 [Desmophyllum pertusum]
MNTLHHRTFPHLVRACDGAKLLDQTQATQRRKKQKTSRHSTTADVDSIALGTSSGDVLVYNVSAGEVNQRLEGGHDSRVNDLCWSQDDNTLYSCSNDKHITEWNTENGQRKCKWKADSHSVRCIRLGPKGKTLLSAGRSIKLWDLETKQTLRKFTGHASPVTQLLFIPSPLSHDSNANHIPSNGINGQYNGQYFISGAEQDRLMNVWYMNLDTHDKNALVSLSLTDEPIAVDVVRHSNRDKPIHIAVASKDGQLHIFEYSLNGGRKKPLRPTKTVQLVCSEKKDGTPSPIPVLCIRLLSEAEPEVLIAYGSTVKPQFETLAYSTMEEHTCLIRQNTSNLLLSDGSHEPFQVDKGAQVSFAEVTTLGPGNMALATPTAVSEVEQTKTKNKTRTGRPEEQSIEDRLKAINTASSETQTLRSKESGPPTAGSLAQMLIQALHSQDSTLLEDVLRHGGKKEFVMKNTIKRLPVNLAIPFLTELVHKIQATPWRAEQLVLWIKHILSAHMAYLMTVPDLVDSLSGLYTMAESRVDVFSKLCKLQGRLDLMLSQVDSQSYGGTADEDEPVEPTVVYQEEDSDEEPLVPIEAEHSECDDNWDEDAEEKATSGSEEESENEIEGENYDESDDEES